jgi:hypothetical protein
VIYFIQEESCGSCRAPGLIKIGYTDKPAEERLAALQTGSPRGLRLLAVIDGCRRDERSYHALFLEHSVRGEWFRPVQHLLETIERLRSLEESTDQGLPPAI